MAIKRFELSAPSPLDTMRADLETRYKDVLIGREGDRLHFVNKGYDFTVIFKRGKWDLLVQGSKEDILIETKCTPQRVFELVKSINAKWFKEYDSDDE